MSRLKSRLRTFGIGLAGRPRCGEDAERVGRLWEQAGSGQTHGDCAGLCRGKASMLRQRVEESDSDERLQQQQSCWSSCRDAGDWETFGTAGGKHVKSAWHAVSDADATESSRCLSKIHRYDRHQETLMACVFFCKHV